jgi:hypothetical protein
VQLTIVPPQAPADFDQFWKAYPAKQNKGEARKAFWETRKIRPPIDELLQALENQKRTDRWQRGFIPDPHRWLLGERWEDQVAEQIDVLELEAQRAADLRRERERKQAEWDALPAAEKLARINARRKVAA